MEYRTDIETDSCPVITKPQFRPKHPDFSGYQERLRTFEGWPKYLTTRPRELVEAGFVYTGCGDETFCFYCGTRLKDWKPSDFPKIEHNKFNSSCFFLKMCYTRPETRTPERLVLFDEVDK